MTDTNPPVSADEIDHRFADCDVCGGKVDTHENGVYKTPDERFRHILCEELGVHPPQYQMEGVNPRHVQTNTQYKCGHVLYGPPIDAPEECPVCTVSELNVSRIESNE